MWIPRALLVKGVPGKHGSVIKELLDYLIILALDCTRECRGDRQGELRAEAPSSSLNFPLTNLKALKSSPRERLRKKKKKKKI